MILHLHWNNFTEFSGGYSAHIYYWCKHIFRPLHSAKVMHKHENILVYVYEYDETLLYTKCSCDNDIVLLGSLGYYSSYSIIAIIIYAKFNAKNWKL